MEHSVIRCTPGFLVRLNDAIGFNVDIVRRGLHGSAPALRCKDFLSANVLSGGTEYPRKMNGS
jgi:hypothetical protein